MTFALTDSLLQDIIHALENQETLYAVDSISGALVELSDEAECDEDKIYGLPEWTSADGFKLRERFVDNLHSPVAKDELLGVLHSGRGVFKNFRNVLKSYPEVDKIWHRFKNNEMQKIIGEWYNTLREIWGLEKLDQEPESDEFLVHDDFSFQNYNPETDKFLISRSVFQALDGSDGDEPQAVRSALKTICQKIMDLSDGSSQTGIVCRSLSEDFAGCILVKPVSDVQENVILLTNFFVPERFRGLGIGTELLSMCISKLRSSEKKWLIMPKIFIPETIRPLLIRTGFEEKDFGFLLKL